MRLPDRVSLYVVTPKTCLLISKYLKKSKKIKKPKGQTGKDVIFGSSQVVFPLNRALYITSIGWVNSFTLGAVLISLSLSPSTG